MMAFQRMGIRAKLIVIFVAIKVVPLVLLAWYAWSALQDLGQGVSERAGQMADAMRATQKQTGRTATDDAVRALDERSREAMEALTTQLAREVADFLYDRDQDVLYAATLEPSEPVYRQFLAARNREFYQHGPYAPTPDGTAWAPQQAVAVDNPVRPPLADNARDFHARAAEQHGIRTLRPLFLEMSFVGLEGQERIKVQRGELLPSGLRDVSRKGNTFLQAESYWPALQALKPGEVYVSEVIGPYVPTHWIGPYTPARALELKREFRPQESGYAGLENPVGKRFQGIVRWAAPVVKAGRTVGYVTLALDHAHLMAFSNRVRPTSERFAAITDPASGNYAFMWDAKGRAIAHPRDYFIVGYDPATGQMVAPWLDTALWAEWQASGKSWPEFQPGVPAFRDQALTRKPAPESTASGRVGLDCRYLNFSPQCHGWDALTEHGGSGSFVIFFSGLWKLTTAAAIPYHTGQYGASRRGFGYITMGANVEDFHSAATESGQRLDALIGAADLQLRQQRDDLQAGVRDGLSRTALGLLASTLVMVAMVIGIAIWMAGALTSRITEVNDGIRRFQSGDLSRRLPLRGKDEMTDLAVSFNQMAGEVQASFDRLEQARRAADEANRLKSEFLASMSHELRTPLNGILGFAELLEAELEDPQQQVYAKTIHTSGQHLLSLVSDVLDLAKIEAGRLDVHLERIDLPALLQEAVTLQRGHAQAKQLGLDLEAAPQAGAVVADRLRLLQVVLNLISNALKFTERGSVTVRSLAAGPWVRIEVQDTGVGIKPEHLQLIFEKFRQSDSFLTRSRQGTGLGLTLAKELTERMGGKIGVSSTLNTGSVFYIELPAPAGDALPHMNPR